MPSTYAHYRMGQEVRSEVTGKPKEIIEAYPELFLIGLHGPDILFYYKPLYSNTINAVGFGMHERRGREFFENAAKIIKEHKGQEAYMAYVYGFICHFALDVTCHGYIDEKIAASGVSHTEIEVEFDRELMLKDGLDPIRQHLTKHIIPSMDNAGVIKEFYKYYDENISAKYVCEALNGMIKYNNLLIAPAKIKRYAIMALLKLTGNYKEMHGLVVNYQKNPKCSDSCKKLTEFYGKAKELSLQLINEYAEYLKENKPLNEIYRYTFGTRLLESEENKDAV